GGYTHGTTSAVYVADGPSDAVRAIGHQGMHQYLHLHGAAGLPAWIEEGLALMSEGYAPQGATYTLDPKFNQPRYERMRRIILEGRLLDLPTRLSQESFVDQPHADAAAQDWLTQVWALTAYLEDEGPYDVKFKAMLA